MPISSSNDYNANFKKRKCIRFETSFGVANSIPKEIIEKWQNALKKILANVDLKDFLIQMNLVCFGGYSIINHV